MAMSFLDALKGFAANTPGGLIASSIGQVLDRVLPQDPAARDAAALEIMKLQAAGTFDQRAELEVALAQSETNKAEAATDAFRGGWRPAVGWVCASGLALQFVVAPMASWAAALAGHAVTFPQLDMQTLMTLLAGMLGLGTLRTVEKLKAAA
jgi:hypothetical protein